MLLAADVGGTNARLSLYADDGVTALRTKVYPSTEHASFEEVARSFLADEKERPRAACVGVAGPVVDGRCSATNIPWVLDERTMQKDLGIPKVALINDLIALAYGAIHAPREKLVLLHGTEPPRTSGANIAVIAAGTGLGEALMVWDSAGNKFVPCGTEGGHTDFAPRNDLEIEILSFLIKRVGGRVSYERIVAGPGLGNLYDFFSDFKGVPEDAAARAAIASAHDRNKAIAEHGIAGTSGPAVRAVETFASIYGAEAGNLALKSLAVGGVFVAGGIAASMAQLLPKLPFVASFRDKGRMGKLLEKIPVAIVMDSGIGLQGSARYAASLL